MILKGRVVKLGDNIDTDVILPGKYLTLVEPEELAQHALEGLDPNFSVKARSGVIIIAGENFGCGSSREHAPIALKYAGVQGIIAKSFARIFYRNAINIGLPAIECKETDKIQNEDYLEVNLTKGFIKNLTRNENYKFTPIPAEIWKILSEGGLVSFMKKHGKLPW